MGGGEALVVDTLGRLLKPSYGQRVTLHEVCVGCCRCNT